MLLIRILHAAARRAQEGKRRWLAHVRYQTPGEQLRRPPRDAQDRLVHVGIRFALC